MAKLGASDYRIGARERLEEAYFLLRQERFGGSIYLAGRAVEGMLRAVIWKSDPEYVTGKKNLETGHGLRNLLDLVGEIGVLRNNPLRDDIGAHVQHVGPLWWNDMRFLPQNRIKTRWFQLNEIGGKRTFKLAANEYYDSCSAIVKRCEAI